jgi:hypothetical protein
MKLILRDYIASLKEEGELDVLISNLLFSKGISPLSKTQKGVRQFGVDVPAKGKDEDGVKKFFVVTIKRGDISRKVWNSGEQSVKPSLDDIIDVYLRNISPELSKLPYKIILATNGIMNQEVEFNWNGYVNNKSIKGKIEFEFWDINRLALELETNLLNESIFQDSLKALLRKALALLELNEYDMRHFYQLIEEVLFLAKIKNTKDAIKRLRLLNLCQGIIFKWGFDADNLRNVYLSSERLMLRVSDFFRKNKYFENKELLAELLSILQTRSNIGLAYFRKVKSHCYVENAFSNYSRGVDIEYPLITFEQIGIISLIGLEWLRIANFPGLDESLHSKYNGYVKECTEAVWNLIDNNPSSYFVLFDDHVNDITLALLLFYQTHNYYAGEMYINRIIKRMVETFQVKNFFPLFRRNDDELLEVYLGEKELEITSSHLWLSLAELSLVFGSLGNYEFIVGCLKKFFPNLNLMIWYPDKDTESTYYAKNSMHLSGTVQFISELPEDYRDYIKTVQMELQKFNIEKDFLVAKKLSLTPLIAARHFRNLIFPYYWRVHLCQ